MTAGQRKMHLTLWLVLGPIALIGLALAVVLKPAEPVHDGPLPGVSEAQAAPSSQADADEGGTP